MTEREGIAGACRPSLEYAAVWRRSFMTTFAL